MSKILKPIALIALIFTVGSYAKYNEILDGKQVPIVHALLTKYPTLTSYTFMEPIATEAAENDDYGWSVFIETVKNRVTSELAPIIPFSIIDEKTLFESEAFKEMQANPEYTTGKNDVSAEGYIDFMSSGKKEKIAAIDKLGLGESIMYINGQFSFYEDAGLLASEKRMKKMGVQASISVSVTTKINEKKVKSTYFTMKFGKSETTIEVDSYREKPLATAEHFKPLFEEALKITLDKIIEDAKGDFEE